MPCWSADAEKETTAHSVLFSFQYLLRLFPRDALHRFTALSGHWPFAGDSEASDWQPMALKGWDFRNGLTVYFKEDSEAFVYLFLQRRASSTGSLRRSLWCTPAYWLDCPALPGQRTPRTFQSAPDPSEGAEGDGNGRILLPSLVRHSLCSRAVLTALDRQSPQFLCFGCHFKESTRLAV